MSYVTVGIVDYGVGNHASVIHSLHSLNFRVRVSKDTAVLNKTNILLLPGVGAFSPAMKALQDLNLVRYLKEQAVLGKPMLGICLGMQLLTDASHEHGLTEGLGIIPGELIPLSNSKSHIGWNMMKRTSSDNLLLGCDHEPFYFNHSFMYQGKAEFQSAISRHIEPIVAVIQLGNTVGVQFHPEKSQEAGRRLLKKLIAGLLRA